MNQGRPAEGGLRTALESPSSKRAYVRRLFSTIADRYDLITVLLSFGLDRGWKKRLASIAGDVRGKRVLDLACGTGDIAFEFRDRGASIVGVDITFRMVQLARMKALAPPEPRTPTPALVVGDMTSLPIRDQQFDIVTTGYGLRNVPVLDTAIAEIRRVLRPDGLLLSLDFNRPSNAAVRAVYLAYLTVVGGALGFVLHRDPDTYRYIPESIRKYPGAAAVAEMMRARGFSTAEWIPVLGGLMAIHVART
jgi:demethylmenaquinone methyltransferase/2-methoxy-6-polyprenyl-1,4-benzoquinol methylase